MFARKLLAVVLLACFSSGSSHAVGLTGAIQGKASAVHGCLMRATNGKQVVKKDDQISNQEWDKSSSPVTIAPHRAIYTMSLASVKNGTNITGVTGQMLFEWADVCDGWAIQQHLQLHFTYAEGDESEVNSTVISWESKDGTRYNFNVRRMTDGKETEKYRGRATLNVHGGKGVYTIPDDMKDVELPAGSMFPSAHTTMILEKAMNGEQFFTRRVFDGSDEDGAADVSAFIGKTINELKPDEMTDVLQKNSLLAVRAWPVRLAFFKPDTETGEPDYEMDLVLQANGIARSMQIDYGDFSVSGVLSELESLPADECGE